MSHTCRVCGDIYNPSESAIKKRNYICKPCRKTEGISNRNKRKSKGLPVSGVAMGREYHVNYQIEYSKRPEVKKRALAGFYERMKDPINLYKEKARRKARAEIKSGRLIRGDCEVCGCKKVDAHHDDYDKPIDVRWLCRKHHLELHRNLKQGANNERR